MPRFHCPACGFAVFNRRLARCERCATLLPPEMAYTAAEQAWIEAEQQRIEQARAALARQTAEAEQTRQRRRGEGG